MTRIFLLGFMGSGKTTTGRKLADRLGWQFIDMDVEIEKTAGMSIPELFEKRGEGEFRKIEHETLRKQFDKVNSVIATGGGTPCYFDNMELMKKNGITIYLKMTPEDLAERLANAIGNRPLLQSMGQDDLRKYIMIKLAERESHYLQAHHTVMAGKVKVEELLALVNK